MKWTVVLVVTLFHYACNADFNTCQTPKGGSGRCEPIIDCDHLLRLSKKTDITKKDVFLLRKSACGFEGMIPKVCCPDEWEGDHCHLTGIPPDPRSQCCGVTAFGGDKIIGGQLAAIDQFPWLGIIEYQKEYDKDYRNAVLISGKFALSAAQCFDYWKELGRPTVIKFGEFNPSHRGHDCVELDHGGKDCNEGAFSIPVDAVLTHHDYNKNTHINDIALIKLTQIAPYTDFIRPICLPTSDFDDMVLKDAYLSTVGFGPITIRSESVPVMRHFNVDYLESTSIKYDSRCLNLRDTTFEYENTNLVANMVLVEGGLRAGSGRIATTILPTSVEICKAVYKNIRQVNISLSNTQRCVIQKKKDSCEIDLGSPLMYEKIVKINSHTEIIGIASFALCNGMPDIYTKVHTYRSWILNNTIIPWS